MTRARPAASRQSTVWIGLPGYLLDFDLPPEEPLSPLFEVLGAAHSPFFSSSDHFAFKGAVHVKPASLGGASCHRR
ncbi:hypothetical protein I6A81_04275 [Frankia sp. CN7]|uniref:hypothetical protein n=1 Tax=Frankia nepalensis TaxID=1836974 RepID=UPI001932DF1C|nr:hypothetical protein [Frankia nepalensis]MBL7495492.1 hypothetical protein [Frankia nepalensis]MBL7510860.1 hypothetical protein [Frankia nepalensis]